MRNTIYGKWKYTENGYCEVVKKKRKNLYFCGNHSYITIDGCNVREISVQNPSYKNISVHIGAGNFIVLVVFSLPAVRTGIRFPTWVCDFSLYHILQNFCQAHPASDSLDSLGSSHDGKAV